MHQVFKKRYTPIVLAFSVVMLLGAVMRVGGQTVRTQSVADTTPIAAAFIMEDAYGHKTDIKQLRGKVVFINFWSLTCVPCKVEMPTINNLYNHYKNDTGLVILPIDLDHNVRDDYSYFGKQGFSLKFYFAAGVVPKELFMGELPTTAVIDRTGKIAFFQQGEYKYDTPAFFTLVDSLLRKEP